MNRPGALIFSCPLVLDWRPWPGFFFNAVVSNAYMVAVACGQPNLPLKVNLFALVVYLPALYWLTRLYGISGAAAAYVMLRHGDTG